MLIKKFPGATLLAAALSIHALGASTAAQAQVAPAAIAMAGNYQNFDVLNNTGAPTCGFEMEVYGVSKLQLTRIFPSNCSAKEDTYPYGPTPPVAPGLKDPSKVPFALRRAMRWRVCPAKLVKVPPMRIFPSGWTAVHAPELSSPLPAAKPGSTAPDWS